MSANLPNELFPIDGALALVRAWPRLGAQPSNALLVVDAVGPNHLASALVWTALALLRWVDRHDAILIRILP